MGDARHIAIIHRHGARYVCKEAFDLLQGTQIGSEWINENVGQLTEIGHKQSEILGKALGERLLGKEPLSDTRPLWVSSEKDRVKESGRSFLIGLEQATTDDQLSRELLEKYIKGEPENMGAAGISGLLEEPKDPNDLFRAFKTNMSYVEEKKTFIASKHFKDKANKEKKFLEEIFDLIVPEKAADIELVDKLDLVDALVGAIECERHMQVDNLTKILSQDQSQHLYKIGRWLKNQFFFRLKTAKTLGKPLLDDIIANSPKTRLSVYSAHDHSICSVLASLGVSDYPVKNHDKTPFISFGAYLVLEFRRDLRITSARFNPQPFEYETLLTPSFDQENLIQVRKTLKC